MAHTLDDLENLTLTADADNVLFEPPSLDDVQSAAVYEYRSPNITAMAAISGLCNNPHAASSSFASYTDDRQGPFIDEYDDDMTHERKTDAYRDFALESDDGKLNELSHQIANMESDINEMKTTLEGMVTDVSDASCSANDASKHAKETSETLDDAVSTILEKIDGMDKRLDLMDSTVKGIHSTLHQILALLK